MNNRSRIVKEEINISEYDYTLPEQRIAKYPLQERDASKLLVYSEGEIYERFFKDIAEQLPEGALLMFNNTKVIRARLIMHKPTGARVEIFCLEPHRPADYERAFAAKGRAEWKCIIGNLRRWKTGAVEINFEYAGTEYTLKAYRINGEEGEHIVRFEWDVDLTFGQMLEHLGRIPIPPYLNRESEELDNSRYQTVYSKLEGSVAAPTAGLHFTESLIEQLRVKGVDFGEVTLHVGAGTFLPVKQEQAMQHNMHIEHFEFERATLKRLIAHTGRVVAVGTTTVRTLESLTGLGYRVITQGSPDTLRPIGQWELYDIPNSVEGCDLLTALLDYMNEHDLDRLKAATRIMITPGYRFRVINRMITNFHQSKSTLLLLVSAFVGDDWRRIYKFAMDNDFRFLSYGDSTILVP